MMAANRRRLHVVVSAQFNWVSWRQFGRSFQIIWMYVCLPACMFVCIHHICIIHTCVCVYIYIYICIYNRLYNTWLDFIMCIYVCVCIYIYSRTCTHAYLQHDRDCVSMYVYVLIYMCACVCVCVCVCVYQWMNFCAGENLHMCVCRTVSTESKHEMFWCMYSLMCVLHRTCAWTG